MKILGTLMVASALALTGGAASVLSSGTAIAQTGSPNDPARANTADPNSAPLVREQRVRPRKAVRSDPAARANTADPNSAPLAREQRVRRTTGQRPLDPTGRANTSDPNSEFSGATGPTGRRISPMTNPGMR